MQKKNKALLSVAIALIMVFALATTALADDYSSHWSNFFVNDAISKGWISVDANGNVQPDAQTTRGQYALMMWKSLGSPAPTKANPFTDIPETSPYYNAARALYEAEITTGMTATTFGPDVNLNREMACTMLSRAHKLAPANANAYQQFADHGQISDWAQGAISAMVEAKYIEGIGNNMFAPKQNLKNGEMIKIVMNVANGMAAAAAAAQQTTTQQQAAAIAAVIQHQATSSMSLSLDLDVQDSNMATIIVTVSDKTNNINYVGLKPCAKGDTFENNTGFTKQGSTGDQYIDVYQNGWYAVCATSNKGGFIYKLIEVTGITDKEAAPLPTTSQSNLDTNKGSVTITVDIPGTKSITKVTYVDGATDKSTYTSSTPSGYKTAALNIRTATFEVFENDTYAVLVEYSDGKIAYKKFDVDKILEYTLTVSVDGSGGNVAIGSNTGPKSGKYFVGETVTIHALPDSGYTFEGWYNSTTAGATKINGGVTYTVTITGDTTLYAKFIDSSQAPATTPCGESLAAGGTCTEQLTAGQTCPNESNHGAPPATTPCGETLTAGGTCQQELAPGQTCPDEGLHGTPPATTPCGETLAAGGTCTQQLTAGQTCPDESLHATNP